MKSMFTMGFFSNDVFQPRAPYLGQVTLDLAAYLGSINDAFNKLTQVNAWMQANPNYVQLLGGQASNFQNLYNRAQGDASTATNIQGFLQGYDPSAAQVPISQADKDTTDAFISEANQLLGITQSV